MENVPATTNSVGNSAGMTALSTTSLGTMQANVSRQPIMKQIMFLVAIAASIAIGGYVLMWSQTPNYQVLFSGMQAKESSEVVAILQQSNIDYKLDHTSGALLVPASEVQALRMKLAAEGLPRSSTQGMEMLNNDQGFGTSQFVERARYQRAMEEELSRSISQLNNVQSARVHLATPKQSVFVRDRKAPTASVILNLYAGRNIEPGQVTAITHMVASSVPNMSNADVTVVDQRGRLLSKNDRDANVALSDTQLEYTQKLEKGYISRIEDILSPIVGIDGVRAQVVAEVDFTVTEQTRESYNPDLAAVRSEQIQEEKRVGAGGAFGVPGALTNQPPGGGIAPETVTETVINADGTETQVSPPIPGSSSKNSTRNFELDRTISHTRVAPGSVRKLSVAVLIDERHGFDAEGKVITTALTEAEMTRINALVMDAIGFNQARGDSLNVVNAAFMAPVSVAALPDLPLWEQTWVWDTAKQLLGALLVLFLIFGVIRPAFKDLNKVARLDDNQNPEVSGPDTISAQAIVKSTAGDEITKITTGSTDMEEQLNNVRSLVQQDPALVAQVVKNWSASNA